MAAMIADLTLAAPTPTGVDPLSGTRWGRLRGFVDYLAAHPDEVATALTRQPAPTGNAVFDSLLAGIAEKLADDHDLPRPTWTTQVPAGPPWQRPGTRRAQHADRLRTPPQLAARGIWLPAAEVWAPRLTPPRVEAAGFASPFAFENAEIGVPGGSCSARSPRGRLVCSRAECDGVGHVWVDPSHAMAEPDTASLG